MIRRQRVRITSDRADSGDEVSDSSSNDKCVEPAARCREQCSQRIALRRTRSQMPWDTWRERKGAPGGQASGAACKPLRRLVLPEAASAWWDVRPIPSWIMAYLPVCAIWSVTSGLLR